MPARTVVLAALVASCVSSLITLAASLLVLAPALRAAADAQAAQPLVRAERFELIDGQGTILARLGPQAPESSVPSAAWPWPSRVALEFLDRTGRPRASVGLLADDIPFVATTDIQGALAMMGAAGAPGQPPSPGVAVAVGSTEGRPGGALAVVPDGSVLFELFDQQNQERARMQLQADGTPSIDIHDASGQTLWRAP